MSGFFKKIFSNKSLCWMESVKIITDLKEDLYIAENENKIVKPMSIAHNLLEIDIHNRFDHPNIIRDTNLFVKSECNKFDFCREFPVYYTFEQFINDKMREINWETFSKILYQLADALEYVHENNIVHCNLTYQAVFIDQNGNVKLGGFENACIKNTIKKIGKNDRIYENDPNYIADEKTDVIGYTRIVLYFISKLSGFKHNSVKSFLNRVFGKEISIDQFLDSLIEKMKQTSPLKLISGNYEKLRKLLKIIMIGPKEDRVSFKDIKKMINYKTTRRRASEKVSEEYDEVYDEDDFYYDDDQEYLEEEASEDSFEGEELTESFEDSYNKAKNYINNSFGNKDVILLFLYTEIYFNMCEITNYKYCQECSISSLYLTVNILNLRDEKKENIKNVVNVNFFTNVIKSMKGTFLSNETYEKCNNVGDLLKSYDDILDFVYNPEHQRKKIKGGKIKNKNISCREFLKLVK